MTNSSPLAALLAQPPRKTSQQLRGMLGKPGKPCKCGSVFFGLTHGGDLLCCFCDEAEVFPEGHPEVDKKRIWKRVSLLAHPDGTLTIEDHAKWLVEIEREPKIESEGGQKPKRRPEDYGPGQIHPDGTVNWDNLVEPYRGSSK